MKLNFGMIGGGNGAFIGNVHRQAGQFDNLAVLSAGCFTRNPQKNRETAELWGVLDSSRVYADYEEMAQKEALREDPIDFVCIATPNDTHFDIAKTFLNHGIHVMCDKPLALTVKEGLALQELAKEKDLLFGVTYTYTGYAMVRQAREMVKAGTIGRIVKVIAEYPQEWLAVGLASGHFDQAAWRKDPQRSGPSGATADIGTHMECLIAKMTGLKTKSVLARFNYIPDTMQLENDADILIRFSGDIPGMLWVSQIAIGHETEPVIRIFGDKGSLEWTHLRPQELRFTPIDEAPRTITCGRDYLAKPARDLCRLPTGHPEGFYEAFANLYRGFCSHLLTRKTGGDPEDLLYPTVQDGVQGIRFIDACIASNRGGNVWVDL